MLRFEAVRRQSLSDSVFEQLKAGIVSGSLSPGSALPSERHLAEELGVNRSAVREALKRLEQLRLVAIRQGEKTRVLDYRQTAGLDMLMALLFKPDGSIDLGVARGLVEMRAALGPDIAARAARRRTEVQLPRLRSHLDALAAAPPDDLLERERISFELWRELVGASGNLAYQLAFNSMERVWSQVREAMAPTLGPELLDVRSYRRMIRAVEAGDEATARRAAARLVERGCEAVVALVEGWEGA